MFWWLSIELKMNMIGFDIFSCFLIWNNNLVFPISELLKIQGLKSCMAQWKAKWASKTL